MEANTAIQIAKWVGVVAAFFCSAAMTVMAIFVGVEEREKSGGFGVATGFMLLSFALFLLAASFGYLAWVLGFEF